MGKDICGALKVTAVSSGYCLGSCNWLLCSEHEKLAYLSGSSTLTTHPRPIDQSSLKNADVMIMTALNHTPMYNPDSMLGEFCVAVAQTLRNGGSALVPCYPSGVVYDLFECLSNHLDNLCLSHIPMYFVSPKAESSLAYSNIFSSEPEFDFGEALAPFQPLAMRPVYCPIDTSLDFTQARKLINELKPGKLVVPEVYLRPPAMAPHRTDLALILEETPLTYNECQVLNLVVNRRLENMGVTPDLALALNPSTIRPGLNTSTVTAELHIKDNKYTLKPVEDSDDEMPTKYPQCYPYGNLSVDDLVQRLAQAGLTDAKVEELPGVYIITLENEDVMIKISDASTHIISGNSKLREKLRDILFECLSSF
ncbi:integrator complex subunit 9-like [Macrobrachium nipponense]|uniref:integrator complex subunit 9-like n=1 Tax=Macrobrachium nipponense TaxID=159736 RepID=UPI0030C8D073